MKFASERGLLIVKRQKNQYRIKILPQKLVIMSKYEQSVNEVIRKHTIRVLASLQHLGVQKCLQSLQRLISLGGIRVVRLGGV